MSRWAAKRPSISALTQSSPGLLRSPFATQGRSYKQGPHRCGGLVSYRSSSFHGACRYRVRLKVSSHSGQNTTSALITVPLMNASGNIISHR